MHITDISLTPTNASIGEARQVLHGIHLPDKNISIYQRNISSWPSKLNLLAENSFKCETVGTVDEITGFLQTYFGDNYPSYDFLLQDTLDLLRLFEEVTMAKTFRVLLTSVETNMCSKFHTDINDLRLLCTYAGPGTQWLPEDSEFHKAYHDGRKNLKVEIKENEIQNVDTGDVVILKGALYPEAKGILHRSPAIEKTQEKRFLLRIDTGQTLNFWR